MTHSDIERLAREAGAEESQHGHRLIPEHVLQTFADLVLDLAAKECETLETKYWRAYKAGLPQSTDIANPHTEGKSDGAGECAAAVRAMKGRE